MDVERRLTVPCFAALSCKADTHFSFVGDIGTLPRFLGFEDEAFFAKTLQELLLPDSVSKTLEELREQVDSEDISCFLPLCRQDGSVLYAWLRARSTVGEDGVRNVFGVLIEADMLHARFSELESSLEMSREQLRKTEHMVNSLQIRAEMDALTGLLNPSTTRQLAETYLAQTDKHCAMLIIDVDNFKRINDRFGHMVGDAVMACAGQTIKKLFRSNDIVGRIGGDEFLVLMKDVTERSIVDLRCSQIVASFVRMKCDQLDGESVSCSVGAALSLVCGKKYDALFACADKAMYISKNQGGNRFTVNPEK